MADAAITAVLSKIGGLAVREAQTLLQIGDDIILLRDRLEWLQAFVSDADRKRRAGTDGLTLVWARQTRDVAFEAEEAVDDFFYERIRGVRARDVLGCTRMVSFFTQILVRRGLVGRITRIKSKLDQISENHKEYKIEYTPSMALASSTTAIAAWPDDLVNAGFEDPENTLGFEEDVKVVMRMLHGDQMFVSIVGESGAGKMILAGILYGRKEKEEGLLIVRYSMIAGSSTADLFKELYQLACASYTFSGDEEAAMASMDDGDKLRSILSGQRYLLILGGMTSKSTLNCLRANLPAAEDCGNGSRVILLLDTEHKDVAWHANTMNRDGRNGVHVLTRLDPEASGKLFFWKALRRKGQHIYPMEAGDLMFKEKVGSLKDDERYVQVVHRITGGYRLALVLLAGLLRFKEKPVQWDAVLQQLVSVLPPSRDVDNNGYCDGSQQTEQPSLICSAKRTIEIIFWACFEDLPNELKSCFLYLAAYPANRCHDADTLVWMWIAEGFIKPCITGKSMTMEEVGHDYLRELVLRCLVQLEKTKDGGGIETVRVHKRLMGFLRSEVRESGFLEIHDTDDVLMPPSARRLSIQSDNSKGAFFMRKFSKLRSFICFIAFNDQLYHRHDLWYLSSSRFIRVIFLSGLCLKELPDDMGDLINLRYLRVDSKLLCNLPSSFCRLLNLQTLDIRNTQVKEIRTTFWTIRALRHVLASNLALPYMFRYTDSELQTLHGVKLDISDTKFGKMPGLRSLKMHDFIYRKHGEQFETEVVNLHFLGHLELRGDTIPSCLFTHPGLQSLQTMVLHGTVSWDNVTADVLRKARPNLVQLVLNDTSEVPQEIKEQLGTILVLQPTEEERRM